MYLCVYVPENTLPRVSIQIEIHMNIKYIHANVISLDLVLVCFSSPAPTPKKNNPTPKKASKSNQNKTPVKPKNPGQFCKLLKELRDNSCTTLCNDGQRVGTLSCSSALCICLGIHFGKRLEARLGACVRVLVCVLIKR